MSNLQILGAAGVAETSGSKIAYYTRHWNHATTKPILVFIHGYPQSSYLWRHVVKLLPDGYPTFILDIPGYGQSTASTKGHDKRTVGNLILEALESILKPQTSKINLVLVGHDRGARLIHRLAVDASPKFNIKGVVLLDIVPMLVQWQSFKDATSSSKQFHWPFLANVDVSVPMIQAFGGDVFCESMLKRWSGSGQSGPLEDDALQIYVQHFKKEEVIRASCEDYKAGAEIDVEMQVADQKEGRKLQVPTLIVYSETYLGSRYNIDEVWKEWIQEGTPFESIAIGGGVGHFLPEEAAQSTTDAIIKAVNLFSV